MKIYKVTVGNRHEIKKAIDKMKKLIFGYEKIEAEGTFTVDQLDDLGDWSIDVEEANNTATMGLDFTQMDADTKELK